MDRVAKVITPAAFHHREREPTPSAIEAAEALAWEANRLHLSQSAYRVDDGSVPDAYFRTPIAARRTFQTREQYERTEGCLEQLPGERPEAKPPKHAGADSYYEAIDLVCRGRAFFSTEQGRTSFGPLDTLTGDQYCVFHALPTPTSRGVSSRQSHHWGIVYRRHSVR